jgi:peptide/nickel transport system substrate-binding protein
VASSAAVAAVLGLALAVGAPRGAGAADLRVGLPGLPASAEPAAFVDGPALVVPRLLYQGLVAVGDRGDLEPALATQWSVSRDGLTWTFRIRPDAQLSSGQTLTADDVALALAQRVSDEAPDPAVVWSPVWRGPARLVREVRRGDPGMVQILLAQPFSPLLALLAHPGLAIATPSADGEARVIGTGPYRLAAQAPGQLTLEAVTAGRAEVPRARRIVIRDVPDDATGVAGLAPRGELDVYFAQAPPAWGGLGLGSLSAPTRTVGLLAFRTDHPLLSRKGVRQAIAAGLDPGLIRPALGSWAGPLNSYLPPGAWAARGLALPPHDPARARRLLAQAGVTAPRVGLLITLASAGPDLARLGEALRVSLASAGIDVTLRAEPAEVAQRLLRQGDFDLAVIEATQAVDDPHFLLRPLLSGEAPTPATPATNVALFKSPLVDGMLSRASQLGFRPERLRLYQRLQVHLAEELPHLPLYTRVQWLLVRPGIQDLGLDPVGRPRLEQAWTPDEAAR